MSVLKVVDGQTYVAIAPRNPSGLRVDLDNGRTYVFNNQHGVVMAWVLQEDEVAVMGHLKTCCGGRKKKVFNWASEGQVRIYEGLGR